MFKPIKVVDIELSQPLVNLESLDGYAAVQALVRLHGTPIGYIKAPIVAGGCRAETISKIIMKEHSRKISRYLLQQEAAIDPENLHPESLWQLLPPVSRSSFLPFVTVAVCTRDRTADLTLCLEAISLLDYPELEVLVVDNAPTTRATEQLVRRKYPWVRYIREDRPGLDWARNRAISEARGEIIAFTDDDVIVDAGWIKALAAIFANQPEVMAVTGLITPYELETEAQLFFEEYGGFGRGFERKLCRVEPKSGYNRFYHGTGQFGAGANMAYRRSIFDKIGGFDPALDVGTVTNGGGDIEMFFRVLKEGYTLVYEPEAIVRHRHRREYSQLRVQVANNGIAFASCLVRCALAYPDERFALLLLSLWFLWGWNIRPWLAALIKPASFPRDLIKAQFLGFFVGLGRYQRARVQAARWAAIDDPSTPAPVIGSAGFFKPGRVNDMQGVER